MPRIEVDPTRLQAGDVVVSLNEYEQDNCHCDVLVTVDRKTKRQCYVMLLEEHDEGKGYVPSLVTEDEPGYRPMRGDPSKHQTPWYWGKVFSEAQKVCAKVNQETWGVTEDEAAEIVRSSMRAGKVRG